MQSKYLNTFEIKQIVDGLNRPPFMQHLSMKQFDDKAPLELLELVNNVFLALGQVPLRRRNVRAQLELGRGPKATRVW